MMSINIREKPSARLAFVEVVDTDPDQQLVHWKWLRPTSALFADKGRRLLNRQACAQLPSDQHFVKMLPCSYKTNESKPYGLKITITLPWIPKVGI